MKAGDSIQCPVCGEKSVLKSELKMDGWKPVGAVLKCALCGTEIQSDSSDDSEPAKPDTAKAKNALLGFLGESEPEKHEIPFSRSDVRFCRDCVFRVVNAFRIHCSKHNKDVGPMDDCPDWTVRPPETEPPVL